MGDPGWKHIFEGLKGHPNELLIAAVLFAGVGLLVGGFSPWIACGFPVGAYVLYGIKTLLENFHKRQMAMIDVQKLEIERGKALKDRTDRALERRREKHGKS
jgi:hypothetical protein